MRGFLNLNKPAGKTSRDLVDVVGKVFRTRRAGHAGTLDPMATGVLVVAVGLATRLVSCVQDQRKEYRAEFLLGRRSDTDDVTGTVIEVPFDPVPERSQLEELLPRFLGRIQQVPPTYSAVKLGGQRAYAKARREETFEIPAREVEVFALEIFDFEFPRLSLRIECGSGTYVRSIGRDLGNLLGCGAVMSSLVRTRVGEFRIEDALSPDDLSRETPLLPLKSAVTHLPQHTCTPAEIEEIRHGRAIAVTRRMDNPVRPSEIALLDVSSELIALARLDAGGIQLRPYLVLRDDP